MRISGETTLSQEYTPEAGAGLPERAYYCRLSYRPGPGGGHGAEAL